jgi:hypothetical protein
MTSGVWLKWSLVSERSDVHQHDPFPPPLICVADTSVLIEFKRLVKIEEQWTLLEKMRDLVRTGALAFPRQVAKELAYGKFPDAPGAWIATARQDVCHSEPSDDTLREVLGVAEQLVDFETTDDREVADPYVAAMARELTQYEHCRVVVATGDRVDRLPLKMSLATACTLLNLECWTAEEFVDWVRQG